MKPCTCERLMHQSDCEYNGPEITAAALDASEAARAALVAACVPESPLHDGVFGCLLCGWDVIPSDPSTHEPSCLLAEQPAATATEGQ